MTPQQFVESFLREKAAAWGEARAYLKPVFSNYFGNPLLEYSERFMPRTSDVVIGDGDVTQTNGGACVITHERIQTLDLRVRYRLEATGDTWKIVGIDRLCVRCRGTGQFRNAKCELCDGEGFRDCTTMSD